MDFGYLPLSPIKKSFPLSEDLGEANIKNNLESVSADILCYNLGSGVEVFSTRRDASLPFEIIRPHQVHGINVVIAEEVAEQLSKAPANLTKEDLWGYDAIVTAKIGLGIAIRTADCIPILLYDPYKRVIAAVHSGWKGTVQKIVFATINVLKQKYDVLPANLRAVIGPGIAFDSFQVGEEVVENFRLAGFPMNRIYRYDGEITPLPMQGGHHINLFEANCFLLESAGVLPENIQLANIDTYLDSTFFSARREGLHCGRIINGIRMIL